MTSLHKPILSSDSPITAIQNSIASMLAMTLRMTFVVMYYYDWVFTDPNQ